MIGDEKTEKKPDPAKPQINVVTHADYERHKKRLEVLNYINEIGSLFNIFATPPTPKRVGLFNVPRHALIRGLDSSH